MAPRRLVLSLVLCFALGALAHVPLAAAQDPCEFGCDPPPGPTYSVGVSPNGQSGATTGARLPNTAGYSARFVVHNFGTLWDQYTITCTGSSNVTCTGTSVATLGVNAGDSAEVFAYYSVGVAGVSSLWLNAASPNASGGGMYTVPVGNYTVAVTPDNRPMIAVPGANRTASFTVANTGQQSDTYSLTCTATGNDTCVSVLPTQVTLAPGASTGVSVTFTPGALGTTGVLQLRASSSVTLVSDTGTYQVYNNGPGPIVSLAPHNAGYRDVSKCVANCFDVAVAHATVPYFSMSATRSVALAYNSSTARPTPVVFVDVSDTGTQAASQYSVQLTRASNGAALTLLNGATSVYFTPGTTLGVRLAAAFDAASNGLSTGWVDINVSVTGYYGAGPRTTTLPGRILVVNQRGSAFGLGVDMVGLQRAYTQPGSWAVLITEGDGSSALYDRCSTCAFSTPGGTSATLTQITDSLGTHYRRTYLDSSYVDFYPSGRMWGVVDRYHNVTKILWTDTLLTTIRDPMGKSIVLTYVGGKIVYATDPPGRVTSYFTDGSGHLFRITDPDNVSTNFLYSASDLLTRIIGRGGDTADVVYDAVNRLANDSAQRIQIYTGALARPVTTYASTERVAWQPTYLGTASTNAKPAVRADTIRATVSGPSGATVRYTLDRFGSPTAITDVYGQTSTMTRDTMSRVLVTVTPNGHITRNTYTGYFLTQTKDSTTGRVVNYSYNIWNELELVSGDVTPKYFYYNNSLTGGPPGALNSVSILGWGIIETHGADSRGRDSAIVDASGHATWFTYDPEWGNVSQVKDGRGNITRVHYDHFSLSDSSWAPLSGVTTFTHDSLNRTRTVKNPLGQVTQFIYGPVALNRVVDPKNQVYKFVYNALGQPVAHHDLADTLKADTLKYDEAGNLRTVRTRRGDVITMTYDIAGRLLSRSGPDFPTDSFAYDPAGRWTAAWNSVQRDTAYFDAAGRLSMAVQRLAGARWGIGYSYDIQNRLINSSVGSFAYDSVGGLDTLCSNGGCLDFTSNAELLPGTETYNLGAQRWSRNRQFNATHAAAIDSFSIALLDGLFGGSWTYDSLNRLSTEDSHATGFSNQPLYQYDAIGRLTVACDRVGTTCTDEYGQNPLLGIPTYAYDPTGNRVDSLAHATIGVGNRTSVFRGYTLGYDANGSVISKSGNGISYTYTWDALGRLKEVRNFGNLVASFAYDASGRRVSKTTTSAVERYVYDGDQVVYDLDGTNAIKVQYGYRPGVDRMLSVLTPGGWGGYVLTDPVIGTVRGITSVDGTLVRKKYRYTPWGEVAADTGVVTRFRMAGREFDQEIGLYYVRARYYDPQTGRFLSEDPAGGAANLYAYAGNDPVNSVDPTGLCHYGIPHRDDPPDTVCPPVPLIPITVPGDFQMPITDAFGQVVCDRGGWGQTGLNAQIPCPLGPDELVRDCRWIGGTNNHASGCPSVDDEPDIGELAEWKCTVAILSTEANAALDYTGAKELVALARSGVGALRFTLAWAWHNVREAPTHAVVRVAEAASEGKVHDPYKATGYAVAGSMFSGLPGVGTGMSGIGAYNACFNPTGAP